MHDSPPHDRRASGDRLDRRAHAMLAERDGGA
jgi:hypothetical protein